MTAPRNKAFTLIELLVVISIIALLIGILLPALGAARNTARISASASNQRQIGIAMAAYQADNQEFFPLWQRSAGNNDETTVGYQIDEPVAWYWTTKLAVDGYIPGLEIYADPSFNADTSFLLDDVTEANQNDRVYNWIHYGYNYVFIGSNLAGELGRAAAKRGMGAPNKTARVFDMEDATSVIITTGVRDYNPSSKVMDASTPPIDPSQNYGAHVFIDTTFDIGNAGTPHVRYNDRIQSCFGDGHVATIGLGFTEEAQDSSAPVGYTSAPGSAAPVYGPEALGNSEEFGKTGRFGTDPGNYFDLRASHPGQ
ncbi:MAG: type II secretion system protein [Planctomycetota bacterium]